MLNPPYALLLVLLLVACAPDTAQTGADTTRADDATDAAADADGDEDGAGEDSREEDVTPDGAEDASPPEDTPVEPSALLATYPLEDSEAYPEAVTFDPVERAFFTGSMARGNVLRVDATDGSEREFFPGNQDGESWLVLGLEADSARRRLWVCAAFGRELSRSELWLLDLDTGERLWSHDMEATFSGAACTDVIVADDGTAYICDREHGLIYDADADARTVEIFTSDLILDPGTIGGNGIALTEDEAYLLIIKFLPFQLIRVTVADPQEVVEVSLPDLETTTPESGGDAIVYRDGVAYIITNSQLIRATPTDATWSEASLEFHRPQLEGDDIDGFSGLTLAEGALYASRSDVILFALGLPPSQPFRIHRVEMP